MIAINLYAQPGAGKSTTAAYVFSFFKNRGKNIELITEYAKQLVYSRRHEEMGNQIYLLAKQYKKMKDVEEYGKVPVIITDCPLPLGLVYAKNLDYYIELSALTWKLYHEFDNINIFIERAKPYNPSGRNQTEEESDKLSEPIRELINFDYVIKGNVTGQCSLAETLFYRLKGKI